MTEKRDIARKLAFKFKQRNTKTRHAQTTILIGHFKDYLISRQALNWHFSAWITCLLPNQQCPCTEGILAINSLQASLQVALTY